MNRETVALRVIYITAVVALLMDIFIWRPL